MKIHTNLNAGGIPLNHNQGLLPDRALREARRQRLEEVPSFEDAEEPLGLYIRLFRRRQMPNVHTHLEASDLIQELARRALGILERALGPRRRRCSEATIPTSP